jgi:antibiotic biosynthesis monooxygenase (ABM) superfamily enzyme
VDELMSRSSPNPSPPRLEVRDARVSSVIIHRVPSECTAAFLDWQRGISQAAEAFPGYRGTDLYPPAAGGLEDWVVIIHFDAAEELRCWIDSPVRADWAAKLPGGLRDFRVKTLPSGFGPWFAKQFDDPEGHPPSWKMALTVLLGLYPTVMLLSILVGPFLARLGMAASMVVGNALSVSILQWGVMPLLQPLLRPWLVVGAGTGRARSAAWLALILVVLAGQVTLFRRIAG